MTGHKVHFNLCLFMLTVTGANDVRRKLTKTKKIANREAECLSPDVLNILNEAQDIVSRQPKALQDQMSDYFNNIDVNHVVR